MIADDNSEGETVKLALNLYLEEKKMKEIEAYAKAGRRLKNLSDDELRARYLHSMQEWAIEFPKTGPGRMTFDDCEAEYAMRRQTTPRDAEISAALELLIRKTEIAGYDLLADTEKARQIRENLGRDVMNAVKSMLGSKGH